MVRQITGNYATIHEAETAVQALLTEGYPKESITLIVDKTSVPSLEYQDIHVETIEGDDVDESLWERIKGFFGGDDDEEALRKDYYEMYSSDLSRGHILVSIETELIPEGYEHDAVTTDQVKPLSATTDADAMDVPSPEDDAAMAPGYDSTMVPDYDPTMDPEYDPTLPRDETNPDEVLRMREERLDINKENVQTGEAVVRKVVTEETQTIEVPVTKEELVIERKAVNNQASDDADFLDEEEIRIPLSEEQVHVTKEPVVTEEVHITKRDVHETKSVSDTIHKEHLDVESPDDSLIQDNDINKN